MSTICCEKNVPNTGIPSCAKSIRKPSGIFFQAKYDNNGNRNQVDIDSATVLNGIILLNAMLSDPDPSKRMYPLSSLKDIEITSSEPQYREFKDGTKELTQEAIYSFMGMIAGDGVHPYIVGQLKKINCREFQFYIIPTDGGFVGDIAGTKLNGIEWTGFYAMGGFANFEKQSDVTIRFDFNESFKYENLYMISAEAVDVNLLEAKGVIPANITIINSTTTTARIRVSQPYGDGLVNKNNVVGLLPANIRVKRLDTGIILTPATAVEDVVNQWYDLTFTAIPTTTPYEVYLNLQPTFKYEGKANGLIGV